MQFTAFPYDYLLLLYVAWNFEQKTHISRLKILILNFCSHILFLCIYIHRSLISFTLFISEVILSHFTETIRHIRLVYQNCSQSSVYLDHAQCLLKTT